MGSAWGRGGGRAKYLRSVIFAYDDGMGAPRRSLGDIEQRLLEISIGLIRLLQTVLDKARQRRPAALLGDVLLDGRAYPGKTPVPALPAA
jgi:hypothetical protein